MSAKMYSNYTFGGPFAQSVAGTVINMLRRTSTIEESFYCICYKFLTSPFNKWLLGWRTGRHARSAFSIQLAPEDVRPFVCDNRIGMASGSSTFGAVTSARPLNSRTPPNGCDANIVKQQEWTLCKYDDNGDDRKDPPHRVFCKNDTATTTTIWPRDPVTST